MKNYSYQLKNDYDKEIDLNHKKMKIYSKRKFKELNKPSSDVLGEMNGICLNKHKTYDYFRYDGVRYKICQLNKSFHLLNKTLGYVEVEDKKYIRVLKKTYLIIPVLIGFILLGIMGCYRINPIQSISLSQSETNELTILKGTIYQDDSIVDGASVDLIHNEELIDCTSSDEDGVYLFTGLDYENYYLKVSWEDDEVYRYVKLEEKENIFDIDLPNCSVEEDIECDFNNIYIDGLESLIEDFNKDHDYRIHIFINRLDDASYEDYMAFKIELVCEEYDNGTMIHSYLLDDFVGKEIAIVIADLNLYDVLNVYIDKDGILNEIEDYNYANNSLRFSIDENGIYLIELKEKESNQIGTTTFSYQSMANYDVNTGTLTYQFKQIGDSTNKTRIEAYLYSGDELVEVGQSGVLNIGEEESSMVLNQKLEKGVYDGLLRVYYLDSSGEMEIVDVDIPITIISNE